MRSKLFSKKLSIVGLVLLLLGAIACGGEAEVGQSSQALVESACDKMFDCYLGDLIISDCVDGCGTGTGRPPVHEGQGPPSPGDHLPGAVRD